jgi:hypothetical protein
MPEPGSVRGPQLTDPLTLATVPGRGQVHQHPFSPWPLGRYTGFIADAATAVLLNPYHQARGRYESP